MLLILLSIVCVCVPILLVIKKMMTDRPCEIKCFINKVHSYEPSVLVQAII